MADRASTQVGVRALEVMADIGLHAHEIGSRQPLVVSVTVWIDPVASDTIEATMDYRFIVTAAESLAGERITLIETFARRLAAACLAWRGARRVAVTIDKPRALAAGIATVTLELAHADDPGDAQPARRARPC